MRHFISLLLLSTALLNSNHSTAQGIGIGTTSPNASAQLDISSTDKGILVPRISLATLTDGATILNPATSLLVYNTNTNLAGGAGYFYNSGTPASPSWTKMLTNASTGWQLGGNAGTDPATNFIGTTDSRPLKFRVGNAPSGMIEPSSYSTYFGQHSGEGSTNNVENAAFGYSASPIYGGFRCTAIGAFALSNNQLYGYYNTALGARALFSNTTGAGNTALGVTTLYNNLTGNRNVAIGDSSMYGSTTTTASIGIGMNALKQNTSSYIIGIGRYALENNTGSYNIAIGDQTLRANTTGHTNIAIGTSALNDNISGERNVGVGYNALRDNITGSNNTAYGYAAMAAGTAGSGNTAIGYAAMQTTSGSYAANNVAIGYNTLRSIDGGDNVAVGNYAMANAGFASNNVAVGNYAMENITYSTVGLPWASDNIAIGKYAMQETRPTSTTNGYRNVVVGTAALRANTTGSRNIAIGNEALNSSTTANYNIAIGDIALRDNTTGYNNIAIGLQAMLFNETGYNNMTLGHNALRLNTTGWGNVSMGSSSMYNNTTGNNNTAIGTDAGAFNNANNNCSFFGYDADQASGSNYTNSSALGASSRITASNQVRIGSSGVTSIGGYAAWSNLSDGRFKKNISESVKGLDFIMALRPVTYNVDVNALAVYLREDESKDSTGRIIQHAIPTATIQARNEQAAIVQTGFIAQEVEAAAQKLGYDFSGVDKPKNAQDIYALRYSEFVVPLVKAVQEQQAEIAALKQLVKELKALIGKQAE